ERDLAERALAKAQELSNRTSDRLALATYRQSARQLKFLDGALSEIAEETAQPVAAGFGETTGPRIALITWFYMGGSKPPEPIAPARGSSLAQALHLISHSQWNL